MNRSYTPVPLRIKKAPTVGFAPKHLTPPLYADPIRALPTHRPTSLRSIISLHSHGVLLFRYHDYHSSIQAFRKLLSLTKHQGLIVAQHEDTDTTTAWVSYVTIKFNMGIIRLHLGEYELARALFKDVVLKDPGLAIGWYTLGHCLFELQDYREAITAYTRCLDLFRNLPSSLSVGMNKEKPTQPSKENTMSTALDYTTRGLGFRLEKKRVEFNLQQSLLRKEANKRQAPSLKAHFLNRMPAGLIFEGFEDHGISCSQMSPATTKEYSRISNQQLPQDLKHLTMDSIAIMNSGRTGEYSDGSD
jgi:tetratricopeptide (TPR) repeat protein